MSDSSHTISAAAGFYFMLPYRMATTSVDDLDVKEIKPLSQLSSFRCLRIVGTGTFGRVYLSECIPFRKPCALKVLEKTRIVQLKQVQHVINEKTVLQKVQHPFVVTLYSSFKDNYNLYMAMEYVPGGELFSHLRDHHCYAEKNAVFYAAQVILALEYLHSQSILYRDLKPENLLFAPDGYLKLTDFGFAKILDGITWTLCGTPEYLAPEILAMRGYSFAVDWWSLGILIFEMCAGYSPFTGNPVTIYRKILNNSICYPCHFSAVLRDILHGLLQTDVTRRLGAMHRGAADIKEHPWLSQLDWNAVFQRKLPAPYIPHIENSFDSQHFEKYCDIPIKSSQECLFLEEFEYF
eukprot:gene5706-8993_t